MKKLLLHAFALITALLPLQLAEAAPKPPPVFGGWSPGKTFTFTVTDVSCYTNQGGVNVAVPIPKGAPVFTLGQQVTFTIGKKGELVATGVKLPFSADGGTSNTYFGKPKGAAPPASGIVFKSLVSGEALNVNLDYVVVKVKKRIPSVTWVSYKFNP